jgi:DNA-binding PadR family transcriptional regulator
MPAQDRSAVEAAALATTPEEARAAVDEPVAGMPPERRRGPGSQDPLVGDLRRGGLLPLLVLHFVAAEPRYGNQLIDRIGELTAGAVSVNPNTMYPLLRQLEARGLVQGEWEHPERRSRRFYRITETGRAERDRLAREVGERLRRIDRSIQAIQRELARPDRG